MFNFLLENTGLTLQQFQTEFKTFVVDNRLVGTVAGVTMGITTKDLIQSFVGDIAIPFFYLILFQLGVKKNIELLPGKTTFDYINFIRQLITWVISFIAIFFFVYYFFMSVTGIKTELYKSTTPDTPNTPTTPTPATPELSTTTSNQNHKMYTNAPNNSNSSSYSSYSSFQS